jgi:hypothetical protein
MKNVITSLALLVTLAGFSQLKSTNTIITEETVKVNSVSVAITVDSAEDIESSFKVADIKDVLDLSDDNEIVSFKLTCNGEKMANGVKSQVSYQIEGNSDDKKSLLLSIEKIRIAAINYYKSKK